MEFRLFVLRAYRAQRFFQEFGGEFTIRHLEADSVDYNLALGADDDLDGSLAIMVRLG
jgi:hypothetical protein